MNDTTPIRTNIIDEARLMPSSPAKSPEPAKPSGLYLVRSLRDERVPPSAERRMSGSWIPGAWDDPF